MRQVCGLVVVALLAATPLPAQTRASGEVISGPLRIPKGAAKAGFDITRLNTENYGAFEPFYVTATEPLRGALDARRVASDTRLLVTETAGGRIALLADQMAYHHLAQGRAGGKDWMATFWVVCNSGTSLVPTVGGTTHHFYHVGLHDALFVMQDAETGTLWNHITGEAVYGPLLGRSIGPLSNLLQMNVTEALAMDSAMRVAISDRTYVAGGRQLGTRAARGARGANIGASTMSDRFARTIGAEDLRRPRMEIGLGVWIGTNARYYPMERIRQRGEAFIDRLDGRSVLVYVAPESNTPNALFVNARSATMAGGEVHLDDGSTVRAGVIIDARGQRRIPERPQQMFTRWYGFALTFPGCEIFGEPSTR